MKNTTTRTMGLVAAALAVAVALPLRAYPTDGYAQTGIRRLDYLAGVQAGSVPGRKLQPGQYWTTAQVQPGGGIDRGRALPSEDAELGAALDRLMAGAGYASYSVALLDLSEPARPRYAERNAGEAVNVGSVGKLLVALALFQTLADLYPKDIAARERVLREARVIADAYSQYDHHAVTFWNPAARQRASRRIRIGDEGSLWEYLDWMLSASSNSAAGMVQKELLALKHFGNAYPVPRAQYDAWFAQAKPKELGDLYLTTMDDVGQRNGIEPALFRQGSFFTRGGKNRVNGTSSYSSSRQLLDYLHRLEAGSLVDAWSSRELKRLMYMTQRRIRYASHPALNDYGVVFKSGSFYQCHVAGSCGKYRGDKTNRLASVAIVEAAPGAPPLRYLVAVTSNVLRVNSAVAHQTLALRIHRMVASFHQAPATLPEAPSAKLVAFLWANTLLLAPVAVVGALCGCRVLGDNWAWSASAARLGCAYALPWIVLSFVPLDKWFPSMSDVTAHTELITASALGVEFGGAKRSVGVALATTLISVSAGIFEEAAFRGVFQRATRFGFAAVANPLVGPIGRGAVDRASSVFAIAAVSGCFGALHNYCRGYALLAALAGAYFGFVYATTGNLLVAAVAHATVDLVAFATCYVSLCRRSKQDKAKLAAKSFKVTDALRATRFSFDNPAPRAP